MSVLQKAFVDYAIAGDVTTLSLSGEARLEYSFSTTHDHVALSGAYADELYARVWDFVAEQRGNMELQLRALGASCSWDDLTFTLDENVIDRVYTTFEKMWNDGMVYRGEKLVNSAQNTKLPSLTSK